MAKKATPQTKTETKTEDKAPEAPPVETKIMVHDELLDAAGTAEGGFKSQDSKEDDKKYFERLLTAVGELDEKVFDSLSESAQAWYNEAVEAMNAGNNAAAPEGFVSKKGAKTAPATGKTSTEKKTPAPPKEKPPRSASKTFSIRVSVCKDPKISLADLLKAHPGMNSSTVSTIRSDVLATIEAAQQAGAWPK